MTSTAPESGLDLGLLPWQQDAWRAWQERISSEQTPHAVLIHGPEGIGKSQFAHEMIRAQVCTQPTAEGLACGQCHGCRMLAAGAHTDVTTLRPEEGKKNIRIEPIRQLTEFMSLSTSHAPRRIAMIWPADAMNLNAANALLKTLEEPPGPALMVLVTAHPARLPATIRSRCQMLRLPRPERAQAKQWLLEQGSTHDSDLLLALAQGSPLRALQYEGGDELKHWHQQKQALLAFLSGKKGLSGMASTYPIAAAGVWLSAIQLFFLDALRLAMSDDSGALSGIATQAETVQLLGLFDIEALSELQIKIMEFRRLLGGNLNPDLFVEDLLLNLRDCTMAALAKASA
ncbi:DNA polymerase III, delta prime subunit [Ectothiorhodosinus mongolicus]|uniref:DNA-directed DNA polymerase n=1 Tax=Ectothiorhodosinus mongolicus TaxID=233100 RepID=A0A1R3VRM9_9GAMM|nr:DNA polymerase III subunit delta' [Ectothiorhodosinus mongolicus]ULX56277.1 DNA polymerase III subunit delta' [Ectothiorhodosinus mongolicus]SIT65782.1 DNA polymerase III, delta prime subunit [Ectothiorhodosinus mongolicus]